MLGRASWDTTGFFCNGRRPHLEWRQEPQFSFPFLTPITGSLQSWVRRVRPRLVWRNVSPLASRVVHRVTGHLSSCMWNLRFYPDDAWVFSTPSCCDFVHRFAFEEVSLHRVLIKTRSANRGFCMFNDQRGYVSNFLVRPASS